MDSNDSQDATAALQDAPEQGGGQKDTYFLPSDIPGCEDAKPGDTLTFQVVGKTSDGEIEVEHVPGQKLGSDKMQSDPEWEKMDGPDNPME